MVKGRNQARRSQFMINLGQTMQTLSQTIVSVVIFLEYCLVTNLHTQVNFSHSEAFANFF